MECGIASQYWHFCRITTEHNGILAPFSLRIILKGSSDEEGGQTDNSVESDLESTSHHLQLPQTSVWNATWYFRNYFTSFNNCIGIGLFPQWITLFRAFPYLYFPGFTSVWYHMHSYRETVYKSNQSHFPSNQRLHRRSRAVVCNKFCSGKEAENGKLT